MFTTTALRFSFKVCSLFLQSVFKVVSKHLATYLPLADLIPDLTTAAPCSIPFQRQFPFRPGLNGTSRALHPVQRWCGPGWCRWDGCR